MMQPVEKSASYRSLLDHRKAPEMTTTTKKKPRLHTSHSYRSLLAQQSSNDSSQRNVNKKPPFKKPTRSGEDFNREDYQQSPPFVPSCEPGHSLWSPDSFAARERQRRADVAIETQQQQQQTGSGDCYSLEYTHSMILQQEAILADIKREEHKQEAIRKKLLEEQALYSSRPTSYKSGSGSSDLSSKLKHDALFLAGGNNDSSKRHVKDISPAKHKQTSIAEASKQQQQQQESSSSSSLSPSSNAVQRLHGRRVKLFSESRVQEALERGDSVYLLRCIECDQQLLATKDLHNTFCSYCKSVFPTLMGKGVCSTRL
jgi:hypothetical protein